MRNTPLKISRTLSALLLAVSPVCGVFAARCQAAQTDASEPPAAYVLEINGKSTDVKLGQPFQVKAGSGQLKMKLTMKPNRVFDKAGVKFEYPANYSFSADLDPEDTNWTIDHAHGGLQLHKFPRTWEALVLSTFVQEFEKEHSGKAAKCAAALRLGNRQLKGQRLLYARDDEKYEFFAFSNAQTTFLLFFYDVSAVGGKDSSSLRQLKQVLSSSIKFN